VLNDQDDRALEARVAYPGRGDQQLAGERRSSRPSPEHDMPRNAIDFGGPVDLIGSITSIAQGISKACGDQIPYSKREAKRAWMRQMRGSASRSS
jgi:hypothetical protein